MPAADHIDIDGPDPFDTAELRAAVLATWRRSPARLREDANAEESLSLIGYADRVAVELAANASDAAVAAGEPGTFRLSIVDDELRAANTGAPLTAEGVAALASLRASAKRSDTGGIGHFGVGFTAVLSVTDQPEVVSTTGSVRFSGQATAAAIAALSESALDAELLDRDGRPPILRLPWPGEPSRRPPDGFATEVRLPLRPDVDRARLLDSVGDYLLLTLPGLDVIELPDRRLIRERDEPESVIIRDGTAVTHWFLCTRTGRLADDLAAGRPVEERSRTQWRITWAYPLDRGLSDEVVYAPTPTVQALDLPARLIGSFPVDDTRRHLAPGPVTDYLLEQAADCYLDLMAAAAPDWRLRLIPASDFGRSEVDNRLRQGIWERIRRTPLLVTALGEAVRPDAAWVLPNAPAELIELVAQAVPGLLPAPSTAADREALRSLGVPALSYAEMSSALGGLGREPGFWGRLYELLDPASSEELADLPVPLLNGRRMIGARGALVPDEGASSAGWLSRICELVPDLRVVHHEATASSASRRLLSRIGASIADPSALLADPVVLDAVSQLRADFEDERAEAEDVRAMGSAILDLIAAGGAVPDQLRVDLLLTDAHGDPCPVGELLLPEAPLAAVLDPDADVEYLSGLWSDEYPAAVLGQAGVLAGFRIVLDTEPSGPDHDLPDEDDWWDEVVGQGQAPAEFAALADLDLVADDRWPAALQLIRADPAAWRCLQSPAGSGPSYTRWWLANFALVNGRALNQWRLAGAAELVGLYDELPLDLDADFAASVGVSAQLAEVVAADLEEVLARFADPDRRLPPGRVPAVTAALVRGLAAVPGTDLPDDLRSLAGTVVDADEAVVLDLPWLAQVIDPGVLIAGGDDPERVAAAFDVDLASQRFASVRVVSVGTGAVEPGRDASADGVYRAITAARGLGVANLSVVEALLRATRLDPSLTVRIDDADRRVAWWVRGQASWTDGSAAGWGRLIAFFAGDWPRRHVAAALFAGTMPDVIEDGISLARSDQPR